MDKMNFFKWLFTRWYYYFLILFFFVLPIINREERNIFTELLGYGIFNFLGVLLGYMILPLPFLIVVYIIIKIRRRKKLSSSLPSSSSSSPHTR